MRMVDDSFQNRISAEFAQMQAKLDAQAVVLAAQQQALSKVLDVLLVVAQSLDEGEMLEGMDLDGNPVPPDRTEGDPL